MLPTGRPTADVLDQEVLERVPGGPRIVLPAVSMTSVVGFQDAYKQGTTDFPRPIDIYWGIPHNPEPPEDLRHPWEML